MIDVSEILNDPDLCSTFIIKRTVGKFAAGGWKTGAATVITAFGAVRNATGQELRTLPEADQINQALTFRSVTRMNVTLVSSSAKSDGQTSDIIIWQGENYRVYGTKNYSEQGYWWAIAARTAGN